MEALEGRVLLAVTAGEYDTIRSTYPGFNLPASMASVNIIEITPSQLSVANLKGAIATAGGTTLPDLVVLRTTDTQNTITYASSADAVSIDIPSTQGAISIVGFGSKPLTIDAAYWSGVISVGSTSSTTTVNLGAMTLIRGYVSTGNGGGVRQSYGTLNLTNVTISGNTVSGLYGGGGGLYQSYGTATLTNVTISGNTVSGSDGSGGGLHQSYGTATLTNVTISGNTVSGSYGGGGGLSESEGALTMTNVTICGNVASSCGGGMSQYHGTSTLTNVTISENIGRDGGAVNLVSGTSTLRNTIVARNVAGASPDINVAGSSFLSGANNLIGDGSGQTSLVNGSNGNRVGSSASPIDPKLAQGSGFGTGVVPLPGSPAIDAGDDSLIPAGISTDIYGAPRIQGARVNIGAAETVLPGTPGVTYVVTSLADSIAADGLLTLREALAAANSNQAVGDAPAGSYSSADVIQFAPGLSGTIRTNGQAYGISGSVSITGPGISQLTLDGVGLTTVLDIRGGYDVTISGMTITGGIGVEGGGIYAAGSHLTLNQMKISENMAWSNSGGVYLCCGTSTLTDVAISGNTAYLGSGGGLYQYYGTATLTNVTISGNTASSDGGGVYVVSGTSTLTNVTISGNTVSGSYGGGGGMYVGYSGRLTLRNTIVAQNAAVNAPDVCTYSTLSGANNLIGDGSGQSSLVNGSSGNLVGTSTSLIDPQFASMAGTDWAKWDLRLQATSPAVNAGNNAWIPAGITTDITGGARIDGGTVDMGAYELDQKAPTVTAVYVRGSTWSSGYLSFLAASTSGSSSTYGYAIPVGSGTSQLQSLPWRSLNQISVHFSEDVSIAQAQFAIVGSVGSYSISGFSYSSADHVATWSLSAAIGPDKLYVALPGSGASPIVDLAGNVLDGEWTNPSSYSDTGSSDTFPSGNGTAGGDFAFRFDVLPGDSSGGSLGKVNVADVSQTKGRSGLPVSTSTYRSDFDGNNLVNVADVAYVKSKSSVYSLPVNPPVVPVFGSLFSQVSLLLSRKYSLLR